MRRFWVLFSVLVLGVWVLLHRGYAQEPIVETGRLDSTTPYIEVSLRVTQANSDIRAELTRQSGDLDPLLYLVDSSGAIVAENDDANRNTTDALLLYAAAPIGEYRLIATRLGVTKGESAGEFELRASVNPNQAALALRYDVSAEALLAAGYPEQDPAAPAEWTVLAYLGGDTNLEAGIINDLNELELAGGSDEAVRVLALLDRHPEYDTGNGDWQTARLFEVQADASGDDGALFPPTIDSVPLADLGALDSGNGEVLAQFLVWGLRHYPAERYAIVLASHGGGWQGIITDDTELNSILSLGEVSEALRLARREAGGKRFEMLINDACSMGGIEYQQVISRDFVLSLASPEIVVDPALDMRLFVDSLRANPAQDTAKLSADLIDHYIETVTRQRASLDVSYLNYATTRLDAMDTLSAAVEVFADTAIRDMGRYAGRLGAARANAYTYSTFIGAPNTVDMGDLMRQLLAQDLPAEDPLAEAAQAVLSALDAARLNARASEALADRIAYYSVYFPESSFAFDPLYLTESPLQNWAQMLRSYYNASTPRLWEPVLLSADTYHPVQAPQVRVVRVYPQEASIATPPTINVEIVGRRIASGAFTVDRALPNGSIERLLETAILTETNTDSGVQFINQWKAGVDQSVFNWLPFALPVVSDGETTHVELLTRQGDTAALSGRYREPNSVTWNDVTVLFNFNGDLSSVISRGATGAFAEVRIPVGSDFQAYRTIISAEGASKQQPGNRYTWPAGGLTWRDAPPPDGDYRVGFIVRAQGGAIGFDSTTLTVANADLPSDEVGYTDVGLGIAFLHPAAWSSVVDFGNWLNTRSADGLEAVNIYHFPADANLYTILRETELRYGIIPQGEAKTLTWNNIMGLYVDHEYQTQDGLVWRGRAAIFYRNTPLGGRALVISVDAQAASQLDPAEKLLPFLQKLQFIDTASLASLDTSEWRYALFEDRLPFPLRQDWKLLDKTDVVPGWTAYKPIYTTNDLTYAALRSLPSDNIQATLQRILRQELPDADVAYNSYRGDYYDWTTVSYTLTRRVRNDLGRIVDQAIIGRLYATLVNGQAYLWRFETPQDEEAGGRFRTIFEPMLDGFAPPQLVATEGEDQAAFVRAAILAAEEQCAAAGWGTICYASGRGVRVLRADGTSEALRRVGQTVEVQDVTTLEVGLLPDGSVDPLSVAVVTLQANLPDRETTQHLRLVVFGGTSLANGAALAEGASARLQIINEHTGRIALRAMPDVASEQVGALAVGEVADAVGRSADGLWLRVRIPLMEGQTGWVLREFIRATDVNAKLDSLRIADPNALHYESMQNLEVYFEENPDALQGLLIQTAPGKQPVYLQINRAIFEVDGGSTFLWRGDDLQAVPVTQVGDLFRSGTRRPDSWSSEVLTGSVRVQLAESTAEATSEAGGSIRYLGGDARLTVTPTATSQLGNAITATLNDATTEANLTATPSPGP